MQKSIRVQILGKDYPLRVHEEDEEVMREVAHTVDSRMQAFKLKHPEQPDLVAAVIAALALAEEVISTRQTSSIVFQAMDREMQLMDRELVDALSASGTT